MTYLWIALCVLTWLGGALLFFFLNPIFGVLAFIVAFVLTEALLTAHRAEQPATRDRGSQPE